ncbi:family 2 glycosyl transferase [Arthrobacter crystallopoietes BAB-32]|uniref:Family 2 glycosyl transferase n=1 Tax=Arthrobacter crystallopoietes BAB-32 TaxID=1246476 RepID=N1UXR8_9MICC|nr:glycosyltransferase family 2 protein [Arthrobacter crystallopoietes]EMY32647.1 family 2 glycosyl transferase [Arthrobacter crystallopoietes BAB-32]
MTPAVSVVIPCLDDAGPLEACLDSLVGQLDPPFEVIVVDNGCTDDSAEVARRFGARIVHEPVRGIPAAAAAGYDTATGDVIARCDADSVLPPDWTRRLAAAFALEPDLDALTGHGTFYALPRPAAVVLSQLYLGAYRLAAGAALGHRPLFGSNMALRRSCWLEIRDQVHRSDPELHDDLCLSFHIGPLRRVRFDRALDVGISPRAIASWPNLVRRFRRALHTLSVHWAQQPPAQRWQSRLSVGRRSPGWRRPGRRIQIADGRGRS